ncbi:MAG: YgeY family selenium metabolism-linked hydrolase, partial [Anaerolineae bacterium]|nr:YgeY family selenium metabolism-linked hydrolase [Anaerolineae bacterium]MDW8072509.1 YgeY family selenium metabolism-linked hydrolase [Anaerolineae bacterium]
MLVLSRQDQQNLITFLKDLVAVPSFSGAEKEAAERLKQEMERLGFDDVWIDQVGNVVGRIGPGRGPKLLFDGHLDT